MKNSATYYFLLLTVANAWLTWFFPQFTRIMMQQWEMDLEGKPLPTATSLLIQLLWWPAIFLIGSIIGLLVSIILKNRNKTLLHAVIALLLLEGFTLFLACIAYTIPYVTPLSVLK